MCQYRCCRPRPTCIHARLKVGMCSCMHAARMYARVHIYPICRRYKDNLVSVSVGAQCLFHPSPSIRAPLQVQDHYQQPHPADRAINFGIFVNVREQSYYANNSYSTARVLHLLSGNKWSLTSQLDMLQLLLPNHDVTQDIHVCPQY